MKEKINELRLLGYSYNQISNELNCSKGLISYHLNPDVRLRKQARQAAGRNLRKDRYTKLLGGKCKICGYDKCNKALQFHHRDPSKKNFGITAAIWGRHGIIEEKEFLEELSKCDLLCSNCHAEKHSDE